MPVDVRLVGHNPVNNRTQAVEIGSRGFVQVAIRDGDPPPAGEVSRFRLYSKWLGSAGAEDTISDGGNADMGVDGSATAQEFYIAAHQDYDIHIMAITIIIADSAVAHNNFANVGALGTGWDLKVNEAGEESFIINKAKTGGQVIAQAGAFWGYGDGTLTWELSNWTTNEDAQMITVPVHNMVPNGIRIGRGTKDRIQSIINDDLTGLTEFYVRVMGYRHYP